MQWSNVRIRNNDIYGGRQGRRDEMADVWTEMKPAANVFPVINKLNITFALKAGVSMLLIDDCSRTIFLSFGKENIENGFPQRKE